MMRGWGSEEADGLKKEIPLTATHLHHYGIQVSRTTETQHADSLTSIQRLLFTTLLIVTPLVPHSAKRKSSEVDYENDGDDAYELMMSEPTGFSNHHRSP